MITLNLSSALAKIRGVVTAEPGRRVGEKVCPLELDSIFVGEC
jgi:hypothetical protein